ncbi:histidine kinase [Thioalkalivibrio denitrificans]|uniref:histidine kinase n=1 Tax=Thioalkalivibrio denitrificans TaxID=108003 RepID=A0A1V3NLQ6_9GAMM|nr:ATP-binding protein [Thioalkalivibrio denitrificans]OOG25666.1 histidine kinase [Thioalkalivibrio denitrificans]
MSSLSLRVGLIAALVVAVFAVLTALALERAFRDSAAQALDERLHAQLYLLMGITEVDAAGRVNLPERLPEARLMLPGSGLVAEVRTPDGEPLWTSPSALGRDPDADALPFSVNLTVNWELEERLYPLEFHIREDRAAFEAQIAQYRRSLWGWLAAMAVLLLAAQALALHQGLKPLRRVARELRAVEQGRQPGLQGRYPVELRGLTDNLNTLVHHERAQLARYRDALSNLAHSLKTPLAVLRGSLDSREPDRRQSVEQLERMERIVAYQLQRAATSGRTALSAPVAVAPLVKRLGVTLAKVYGDRRVDLEVDVPDDLQFRGNEGDLMELLGNLMDNAWKHGGSRVRVDARQDDRGLELTVSDDGPGIPPGQVPTILTRGGRLDEQVPGQGIGLAVVADIVAAYEGEIEIDQSPLGGARVRIRLPDG